MRALTLANSVEEIRTGTAYETTLADFADGFNLATTDAERYEMLRDEPALTHDRKIDALIGAVAEYLAKQHALSRVPPWASNPARILDSPWHTSSMFIDWKREYLTDGMREYLTFSSPAEFASRNIFTEERPLRRARGPKLDAE